MGEIYPRRERCILLTGIMCMALFASSAIADVSSDELTGDLNDDCFVDETDVDQFLTFWRYRISERADLDRNGRVDWQDASIMYSQYQQHCEQLFTVHRLEHEGTILRSATAINGHNQVVGQDTVQIVRYNYHPYGDSITLLGLPDGHRSSIVHDINDSGEIIGTGLGGADGFDSQAFIIAASGGVSLADLPDTYTFGRGLNSFGFGAGYVHLGKPPIQSASNERAALFYKDRVFDLSAQIEGGDSRAVALNDRFQVTGDTNVGGLGNRAFTLNLLAWPEGPRFFLHHYGDSRTFATGINDKGMVVGYALDSGREQGLLWLTPSMHLTLDGTELNQRSVPLALNQHADVVGKAAADRRSPWHGMLWTRGLTLRIDDVIPTDASVQILEGIDINEHGLILARATVVEPFVNLVRPVLLVPRKPWHAGQEQSDTRDALRRLKRLITIIRPRFRPSGKGGYRPTIRAPYR